MRLGQGGFDFFNQKQCFEIALCIVEVDRIQKNSKISMEAVLIASHLESEEASNSHRSTESPATVESIFNCSVVYLVVGTVLILANTPIVINILRHGVLRTKKEYLLLAGLAGADMLAGWSTLIAGAYRLHLIAIGEANRQMTRWECIKTPHFIVMTFSLIVQAGMLLIISLDRLIAVLKPLQYNTFTAKYAMYWLAVCHILSALYTISLLIYVAIFDADPSVSTINAICINKDVDLLFNTIVYVRLFLATLSVLVYIGVWLLFRKYRESNFNNCPTIKGSQRRLQRHLSVTVGICAFLTFCFYILPTGLKFTDIDESLWSPLYWILNCCNGVMNVFVYSLRHEEIRRGLKFLFTCKKLPTPAEERRQHELHMNTSVTARAAFLILKAVGVNTVPVKIFARRITTSTSTTTSSI